MRGSAKQRWQLLAKAIHHQRKGSKASPGVVGLFGDIKLSAMIRHFKILDSANLQQRKFGNFDIIECQSFIKPEINNNSLEKFTDLSLSYPEWYSYKIRLSEEYSLNIRCVSDEVSIKDLMGFNNTGNVCIWPSEESLSAFVLDNKYLFKSKTILELGGGMTCLAGLFVAKYCEPVKVRLTDGNLKSMKNVQAIVKFNNLENESCLKIGTLKWQDVAVASKDEIEQKMYDFVISADCLFFDETHDSLLDAINYFLSETGQAFIVAPKRGKTFQMFLEMSINRGFHYRIVFRYNDQIWQQYLTLKQLNSYVEDDYPVMLVLTRRC